MSGEHTDALQQFFGGDTQHRYECSRAGCRDIAEWAILWRNPKIHGLERTKRWLACEAHREILEEFLRLRSFPVRVETIEEMEHEV